MHYVVMASGMRFKKYKTFGRNFLTRNTVEVTDIIWSPKGSYFAVCVREKNRLDACCIKIWDSKNNGTPVKVEEYVSQKDSIIFTDDNCGIIRRPEHLEYGTGEYKFVLNEKMEKEEIEEVFIKKTVKQKKIGVLRLENGYLYHVNNYENSNFKYSVAKYSPDGDFLAIGFDDGRVELWKQEE